MMGIAINNESNQNDKSIGISFRRRDQLSVDAIWSVFEKVTQSNARFNALDTITVVLHSVNLPVGCGYASIKTMGQPISVMVHLKKSIVQVKSETNCLAHALIIAIAKVKNDPNYKAYRQRRKIYPKVDQLFAATGTNHDHGGGIPNSNVFRTIFGTVGTPVSTMFSYQQVEIINSSKYNMTTYNIQSTFRNITV